MENSMRVDDVSTHSDIHENIDIESNITSPKDDEDSKHKAYEKYFLHITDEDVQIDSVLSWFNGEPATGKFYVFKRRKDAQQIIDNLKKDGKQAVILGKSIRYSSKKK